MTITLAPELEGLLCERAARDNQDVDTLASNLLFEGLRDDKSAKEEALDHALLASGLVKRIARRTEPDTSVRHLVEVQGEPVSETILRERR